MLIPPDFYTQERIESDLDILRLYYTLCDELQLTKDPKVRNTFMRLSKVAGKPIFLKESVLLAKFINKRIQNKEGNFIDGKDDSQGNDFYNKIY